MSTPRARAAIVLSAPILLVGVLGTPAVARKRPVPGCSGRFILAESPDPKVGSTPTSTLQAITIDATGATVSTDCSTVSARPRRGRTGWRIHTRWKPCGGNRKVFLVATVDAACGQLHGVLRSRKPRSRLQLDLAVTTCAQGAAFASTFNRVEPGDQRRSFLWLKLAAATDPSQLPPGVQVPGAPMPNGLPPLSKDELELVRLWIYSGAPETGTVAGTDKLLNACLPPSKPITIQPLDPPAPGEGVQLVMPTWHLEAHSEHEICFATYYDITAQVPKEFQDPTGTMFRFSGQELRQDPQSHHLLLNRYAAEWFQQDPATVAHDPAFGQWTCRGGD